MRYLKTQQLAVLAAGLVVLLVVLHLVGVLSAIAGATTSTLYFLTYPVRRVGSSLASLADSGSACNGDASAQLEQLQVENSKLRTLVAENAALKTALEFKEEVTERAILARVIAESTDVTNSGLVIDRGADDGLALDQPVIVDDGVIIGKIRSVHRNSATVQLLTDSMSRLAVSIQGGSGTSGLLNGDRGLSMNISLIPQDEIVSPGDMVVTSGLEGGIRRGLIVGLVEKVHKDSQEPFQTATVAPMGATKHPILVQVLVNNEGSPSP
jgi:rod shape-determining protein MreC